MGILQLIDRDLEKAPADDALAAVKTWRYLRLAMVLMVVGLGVSILHEGARACWQGSISAFYYTPAQGFLVGALVTIGVCLFALKGNTDLEDVLLNLAGVCAPFVALVPTPHIGDCGTVYDGRNRNVNIDNNVLALLVVLALTLAAVAVLEIFNHFSGAEDRPSPVEWAAFAFSAVVLSVIWFLYSRGLTPEQVAAGETTWFDQHMHNWMAIAMFVFIWLTVLVNARHLWTTRTAEGRHVRRINRYTVVALLMPVVASTHVIVASAMEWKHAVFSVEASLIALFAYFWLLQTVELWKKGLRPPTTMTQQPPANQ